MKSQRITISSLLIGITPDVIAAFEATRNNFFNSSRARAEELAFERAFKTPVISKSLDLNKVRLKYNPEECQVRSYA